MTWRYVDYQGQDNNQGHMEIYKSALLLMNASPGYYGGGSNTFMQNTYTLETVPTAPSPAKAPTLRAAPTRQARTR